MNTTRNGLRQTYKGAEPIHTHVLESSEAVLLIHGFGGSPYIFKGLSTHISQAGYSVSAPLLPGHGVSLSDFKKVNADQWITEVEKQYDQLQDQFEKVHVVGISMGAVLATILAAKRPVASLCLINPVMKLYQKGIHLVKWFHYLLPNKIGGPTELMNAEAMDTRRILPGSMPEVPMRAVKQVLKVQKIASEIVDSVTSPLIIFWSIHDPYLQKANPENTFALFRMKNKEIHLMDRSYHASLLDYDGLPISIKLTEFLKII